jgi:hypothetical protein
MPQDAIDRSFGKKNGDHRLPFPAGSFIEGFRTPATVQAASLPSAGIRNPQQCLNNYKRLRLMKAISQLALSQAQRCRRTF